ncbi:hypothetical protein [Bifidobacterium simiarum]|uniref:hypothetical protein n=1 Tax=Bifidobacterium simiarum TaxID=2045441 RepID=UPI001BDC6B2B|nr:hypothetical protein [Bifidobacterium simiarum]MBT1166744.1 hypothetical protein [Bifidobacterium simiarum]
MPGIADGLSRIADDLSRIADDLSRIADDLSRIAAFNAWAYKKDLPPLWQAGPYRHFSLDTPSLYAS